MKNKLIALSGVVLAGALMVAPIAVLAQNAVTTSTTPGTALLCKLKTGPVLQDVLNYATCIINSSVIPLIFALAVVSFVWGVVQYVINSDDENKKAKGRDFIIWGLLGLTVMIGVWGLVHILGNTFGIENVIPQAHQ